MADEDAEKIAKAVADHFHPPRDYEEWDRKAKDFRWVHEERGPDDETYVTFVAGDGELSIRALTYREVTEAVLAAMRQARGAS